MQSLRQRSLAPAKVSKPNAGKFTIGLAAVILCVPAFGGSGEGIPCGSAPGWVSELSYNPATFRVTITEPQSAGHGPRPMNPQPAGFPVTVTGTAIDGGNGGYGARVNIPAVPGGCDVTNRTTQLPQKRRNAEPALQATLPESGGQVSDLSLEALFFNSNSGQYLSQDLFGTIRAALGNYVDVAIPDLFADTNGDGSLDGGDLLYSLVDMSVYLKSVPTFSLLDTYSIVNGRVAGLPGMQFSSTPFTFNPATGFGGDGYTGMGDTESEHILQSTPEPATTGLLGLAMLAFWMLRVRRALKGDS